MIARGSCVGLGLTLAAAFGFAAAAEDEPGKGIDYWRGKASAYRLTLESDTNKPLTFLKEPALKWSNPLRQTDDGAVFLWTDRGRPEAIASFYRFKRDGIITEEHEFMSLATTPLTARRDGASMWSPTTGGIVPTPIPDAPAPAATPAERLRQMRKLAADFKAFFDNPPDVSELRALSHPIYRFETEKSRTDVIDGAVFAFVHATDPEVLLVIEARAGPDGTPAWHYAFARMSLVNLRAEHKGRQVWRADWDTDVANPAKSYMTRVDDRRVP